VSFAAGDWIRRMLRLMVLTIPGLFLLASCGSVATSEFPPSASASHGSLPPTLGNNVSFNGEIVGDELCYSVERFEADSLHGCIDLAETPAVNWAQVATFPVGNTGELGVLLVSELEGVIRSAGQSGIAVPFEQRDRAALVVLPVPLTVQPLVLTVAFAEMEFMCSIDMAGPSTCARA